MTSTGQPGRSQRMALSLLAFVSATALMSATALSQNGTPGGAGVSQGPVQHTVVPAMAPTALGQPGQPASLTTATATVHRARVELHDGMMTVAAENSSLNQILREIARQTGIQIVGGVTEERVYGSYGPLSVSSMLTLLLDGTGSNMMLSGDAPGRPKVLTLTPRSGAASPPSPQQQSSGDDDDAAEQNLPPQLTPRVSAPTTGAPAQSEAPPQPRTFTPPVATVDAAPAAAATTTEQSPNGVKTPQQIYDQLMKLQQQQQKAPQ